MGESIGATEATHCPLSGYTMVADSLARGLSLVEVDRKLRGDCLGALAIGGVKTLGDSSMPNPLRCGRDPGHGGVAIERVDECVVGLNRPVRPPLRAHESQKTSLVGECLANGVNFIGRELQRMSDGTYGNLQAGETGGVDDTLLRRVQAIDLNIDELTNGIRPTVRDFCDARKELPSAFDEANHSTTLQIVDDRDGKERVPSCHRMDRTGELVREAMIGEATREV